MLTRGDLQSNIDVPPKKAAMLDAIAAAVIDLWEQKTGRLWNFRQNYVQTLPVENSGDDSVWVRLYPVIEVVTLVEWSPTDSPMLGLFLPFGVTEDEPPATLATARAVPATDFQLMAGTGRIVKTRFDPWATYLQATYTGGYTSDGRQQFTKADGITTYYPPACPPMVKLAMLTQAEFMLMRLASDRLIVKSQGFKGGSSTYEDADIHPLFASTVADNESLVVRYAG